MLKFKCVKCGKLAHAKDITEIIKFEKHCKKCNSNRKPIVYGKVIRIDHV